ncbi:hypothetical protein pb186bvf_003561 [Paramecium bursaria]
MIPWSSLLISNNCNLCIIQLVGENRNQQIEEWYGLGLNQFRIYFYVLHQKKQNYSIKIYHKLISLYYCAREQENDKVLYYIPPRSQNSLIKSGKSVRNLDFYNTHDSENQILYSGAQK